MCKKPLSLILAFSFFAINVGYVVTMQTHHIQASISSKSYVQSIVLDAGHGGFDGGAVGIDNTVEKDINLSIAKKTQCLAQLGGFEIIMVRQEDCAVCDDDAKNKKVSDIHNRHKLSQKYPNAIFLSIHQNKFHDASSWGTQVFYGKANKESKIIADIIQSNVKNLVQVDNNRLSKPAGSNIYVLYKAEVPSVMVECGFISNKTECKKLNNSQYQQKLAYVIINSIKEYVADKEDVNGQN